MFCSPFTAAQWQELENQALIFKHFLAGVPVPPSLLLSVRRSLGSSPACFYTNPTLSYYSYFGKKFDPEPGRCRRTDGKKWRCARDAYPDSKYCERHMHRGKTRSRKPVESQTLPQLQSSSSSSTVTTSFTPSGSTNRCFQNDSLQFSITGGCSDHSSKLDNKDYSYLNRAKTDVDIHTIHSGSFWEVKGLC